MKSLGNKVIGKLRNIIRKAGRLQNDRTAGLLQNEYLILQVIVGSVSVELYSSKIVYVQLPFCKADLPAAILVHECVLLIFFCCNVCYYNK